jgi:hypothetical protein
MRPYFPARYIRQLVGRLRHVPDAGFDAILRLGQLLHCGIRWLIGGHRDIEEHSEKA